MADVPQTFVKDVNFEGNVNFTNPPSGNLPVDDTTSIVQDPVDNTKQTRIDTGAVATATTRTITMPDVDVDLADIATNNAKATNATHTGEMTGSGALTAANTLISNKTTVTAVSGDFVLIGDTSDSGNLKKADVDDFGASLPVVDETSVVYKTGDATANMRIDADNITTATTRVLTMPDSDKVLHQDNLVAVLPPAASNDNTEGYSVGSDWYDVSADKQYVCMDATTATAVWKETTTTAGTPTLPVDDTTSLVQDPVDNTKQGRIDVGNVATATTRVITMPDSDVELFKDNLAAAVAPAVGDDNTSGYAVGSKWIDTAADNSYICVDASTGAAVWNQTNGGGSSLPVVDTTSIVEDPVDATKEMRIDVGNVSTATTRVLEMPDADVLLRKNNYAATAAPTATDDSASDYAVGSEWMDTTNDNSYVCVDSTASAAVWNQTNGGGGGTSGTVLALIEPAKVASNDATIEFDVSGDISYKLKFEDSVPITDMQPLQLQVYVGGSWQTSGYLSDRSWSNNDSVGGNRFTSSIRLSDGDGNDTGEGSSGFVEFGRVNATDTWKKFIGAVDATGSANNYTQTIGGSYQGGTGAVTKIRLKYASGNISSGTFKLYGDTEIGGGSGGGTITDFAAYTPTIQGFGTVTNVDCEWRQVGNAYEIQGIFTSGTPSGSEAQIGLPNSKTVKMTSPKQCGTWALGRTTTAHGGFVLGTNGDAFVNLSHRETFSTNTASTRNALTIETGSNVASASGDEVSFCFTVPITGL